MNRILVSVLALLFLLSGCATQELNGVEVRETWSRPATQGGNGAVYFVIRSSEADELTGVSSDVADAVEMHESRMNGDVMEMHQLKSIPLSAGQTVTLAPGGLHIMLIGLKQDLKVGDEFEITLHFRSGQDLNMNVSVRDTPASEHEDSSNTH